MIVHELKTLEPFFDAIRRGDKNFEVRKDDRAFQAGDIPRLICVTQAELDNPYPGVKPVPAPWAKSKSPINATVKFVLRGGQFGIEPGFVVLALGDVNQDA